MKEPRGTWGQQALQELFGARTRATIIEEACARSGEEPLIGSHLVRDHNLSAYAVWTELRRLERLGMLRSGEKIGRVKPYYVNQTFPLLPGLRSIVQYAAGAVALLREGLSDRNDVDAAFVYGSVAAGDDRPHSDVDVMVIGRVSGRDLSTAIREVERATRRQVNEVHYSREEFAKRAQEASGFLPRVLDGAKVFLKGDEDGLRELAQ